MIKKYDFLLKPLFFIVALLVGTFLILKIEKIKPSDMGEYQDLFSKDIKITSRTSYPLNKSRVALNQKEKEYAKAAWSYFEATTDTITGLPKGNEHVNAFSMSDLGSYLFALASAYELNIIDSSEFNKRISLTGKSLTTLPLLKCDLPNTWYNTSLEMVDAAGKTQSNGGSWSALDISRVIAFNNLLRIKYPEHAYRFSMALSRWNLNEMLNKGYLFSGKLENNSFRKEQEGTLGMEEYSAKALVMAGYDATEALAYTDFIRFKPMYELELPIDARGKKDNKLSNYINNTPFVLDGLENGWDQNSREIAYRLFDVHKRHYKETSIASAFGENYMDASLEKIVNSVYSDGDEFVSLNSKGEESEKASYINTEIAFAWNILYNDEYAKTLWRTTENLYDSKGWFSGIEPSSSKINKTHTAITNGIILEALNYKANGKIIHF
jgi:hypothetical protein